MTIAEAIVKFAKENPWLETPKGAFLQCDFTTYAFIKFLCENHVEERLTVDAYGFDLVSRPEDRHQNPWPEFFEIKQHDTEDWKCARWHMIVETPDYFIDFTARQYKSTAAFPQIIAKESAYAYHAGYSFAASAGGD